MANDTVTSSQSVRSICTPEQHAHANKAKPVILLALGTGPHGKTALLEFPEGWQRTIDLVTQFDGWHPLFADLAQEDRQRVRDHAIPEFVNHPDGTQSHPYPLSFIRRINNARGQLVRFTYFDVPKETHEGGAITGYRCAAELLDALALGYGPYISMQEVLKEVAEAAKEDFYGTNRRAAASAFLGVVGDSFLFFAKHSTHRVYLPKKIADAERHRNDMTELNAVKRSEFVERMKAAKAAKRTARETAECAA